MAKMKKEEALALIESKMAEATKLMKEVENLALKYKFDDIYWTTPSGMSENFIPDEGGWYNSYQDY